MVFMASKSESTSDDYNDLAYITHRFQQMLKRNNKF